MFVYAIYFSALHSVAISEPGDNNEIEEVSSTVSTSSGFLLPHKNVTEAGLGFASFDHEEFMPEIRIARTFTEQLSLQLDVSHQRYLRQDWLE